jgi:hypothetical protein
MLYRNGKGGRRSLHRCTWVISGRNVVISYPDVEGWPFFRGGACLNRIAAGFFDCESGSEHRSSRFPRFLWAPYSSAL